MRPYGTGSRKRLKRHKRKIRRRGHPRRAGYGDRSAIDGFIRYDDDMRLTDIFPPGVVRMLLS